MEYLRSKKLSIKDYLTRNNRYLLIKIDGHTRESFLHHKSQIYIQESMRMYAVLYVNVMYFICMHKIFDKSSSRTGTLSIHRFSKLIHLNLMSLYEVNLYERTINYVQLDTYACPSLNDPSDFFAFIDL
jgi:hypothetical protein